MVETEDNTANLLTIITQYRKVELFRCLRRQCEKERTLRFAILRGISKKQCTCRIRLECLLTLSDLWRAQELMDSPPPLNTASFQEKKQMSRVAKKTHLVPERVAGRGLAEGGGGQINSRKSTYLLDARGKTAS